MKYSPQVEVDLIYIFFFLLIFYERRGKPWRSFTVVNGAEYSL